MAKYAVTSVPPTIALFSTVWASQGYLAANWFADGPMTLDIPQWEAAGRPYNNAIYNSTGQYRLNYAVLRVLSVGPGLLGWNVGDYACMIKVNQDGSGSNGDLASFFQYTKPLPPERPVNGHPGGGWAVAIRVVPVDDNGNPIAQGTTTTTTTTTGGTTGGTTVTGNGGTSGGGGVTVIPPNYYPPPPPVVVSAPPPGLDPGLVTLLVAGNQQDSQLQAAREQRQAQLDYQMAQLDAQREAREAERADERRRDAAIERQQRAQEAEYRRQQRQLELDERRRRLEAQARERRRPAPRYYDDGPRDFDDMGDDLF